MYNNIVIKYSLKGGQSMKEFLTLNKDGMVTGINDADGIDEFMLEALNVLKVCEGKDFETSLAFSCAIVTAVAEKYNIKPSDMAFRIVNTIVKADLHELEEHIRNANS